MTLSAAKEQVAPAAPWVGFLAMCIGMFMAILDIQIVASSLPDIQPAWHRADQLSWVQTAYLIAEIIAIPLTGWLTRAVTLGAFLACIGGLSPAVPAWTERRANRSESLIPRGYRVSAAGSDPGRLYSAFVLFPERTRVVATHGRRLVRDARPDPRSSRRRLHHGHFSWHWLFLINVAPGIIVALFVAAWSVDIDRPNWRCFGSARSIRAAAACMSFSAVCNWF